MATTLPADMPTDMPWYPNRPGSYAAATQSGDQEGRIITIEGQPVQLDREGRPILEPRQGEPTATTEPFEFNEPAEPTDVRVIRVPVQEMLNGQFKYNIIIRPNDLIFVPNPVIGEYYMAGHVARVGVYSLSGRKITLKQAVVSAGMLDQLAIPQRTEIIRRIPGRNEEVFVRVDLAKISAGELPDFYLKPDDVIHVGTNAIAPFLASLRNGFRLTYGFGFLYDRNYANDIDIGF